MILCEILKFNNNMSNSTLVRDVLRYHKGYMKREREKRRSERVLTCAWYPNKSADSVAPCSKKDWQTIFILA